MAVQPSEGSVCSACIAGDRKCAYHATDAFLKGYIQNEFSKIKINWKNLLSREGFLHDEKNQPQIFCIVSFDVQEYQNELRN